MCSCPSCGELGDDDSAARSMAAEEWGGGGCVRCGAVSLGGAEPDERERERGAEVCATSLEGVRAATASQLLPVGVVSRCDGRHAEERAGDETVAIAKLSCRVSLMTTPSSSFSHFPFPFFGLFLVFLSKIPFSSFQQYLFSFVEILLNYYD